MAEKYFTLSSLQVAFSCFVFPLPVTIVLNVVSRKSSAHGRFTCECSVGFDQTGTRKAEVGFSFSVYDLNYITRKECEQAAQCHQHYLVSIEQGDGDEHRLFDVDETLITGKSMFLFLHRYAAEYPLQCGLTAAAIVRQLQALSEAGQPREAINRYYYSLFRHESRPGCGRSPSACIAKADMVFTARWRRASGSTGRGDDVVFVSGSMTDILWPAMAALGWSMPCAQSRSWWMTAIPASSGGPPSANTRRRMPNAMRRKRVSRWRHATPSAIISRICRCSPRSATPAR